MSTNYTEDTPNRSSSRGPRRPRRRSGNDSRGGSYKSESGGSRGPRTPRREVKKLSLWEKFLAFITGKSTEPAPKRAERPERTPRTPDSSSAEVQGEKPKRERKPREPRPGVRKPESVEVTTPRVYVGNLSFDATESDLHELFSGVGIVQNTEIVSNRQTQRSKGFGFVQLQTIDEAMRAVAELHDKEFMGRKLVVSGAKAADRRDEREASSPEPEEAETAEQPEESTEQ